MFERYTDEAKRAIFFARTEAVVRKESAISVKDLLLGLAREDKSRAHEICSLKARDAELRSALGIAPLPRKSIAHCWSQKRRSHWMEMPRRRWRTLPGSGFGP